MPVGVKVQRREGGLWGAGGLLGRGRGDRIGFVLWKWVWRRQRRLGAFAAVLEALKFAEGAAERALQAGFMLGESGEGVGLEEVAVDGSGGGAGGFFTEFGDLVVEDLGLNLAGANEAPVSGDELVEESGFRGTEGLEVGLEGAQGVVEVPLSFGADDEVAGGEAVFEGIEAGGGAALGSAGTGGFLGIAAVGGGLVGCSHRKGLLRSMVRVSRRGSGAGLA